MYLDHYILDKSPSASYPSALGYWNEFLLAGCNIFPCFKHRVVVEVLSKLQISIVSRGRELHISLPVQPGKQPRSD